jgi:hypothetical protein
MVDWLAWLRRLEFTAVAAIVIAGLCLVLGQDAARYAEVNGPSPTRLAGGGAPGRAGIASVSRLSVIDYATTGAISGQAVVLSPCQAPN